MFPKKASAIVPFTKKKVFFKKNGDVKGGEGNRSVNAASVNKTPFLKVTTVSSEPIVPSTVKQQ